MSKEEEQGEIRIWGRIRKEESEEGEIGKSPVYGMSPNALRLFVQVELLAMIVDAACG